ncbi:topoisomerase DNA-binding C4 zinc finger domain-containing protein [Mucilaginibacter lacusdianchii]|uniref:topoisomerase DNA-binding C4 zinc finger domain-containing protein n=1 Tax=Mucilaginibacter lacusdianchii TaxID=2684211 RepID=UPI0034E205B2
MGHDSATTIRCPEYKSFMVKRKGPFSEFYGCTNYPECNGKITLVSDITAHLLKKYF